MPCTAPKTNELVQPQSAYHITFGVQKVAAHTEFEKYEPFPISLEEADEVFSKRSHNQAEATLQLIDKNGRVVSQIESPNFLAVRERVGGSVLRSGNAAAIEALDQWFNGYQAELSIPASPEAVKARLIVAENNSLAPSFLKSATNEPSSYEFSLNSIPRKSEQSDIHTLDIPENTEVAKKIYYTGDAQNRLNIVILGDGYRSSELSRFEWESNVLLEHMLNTTPFSEYRNFINVWRVDLPSEESGATCDDISTRKKKNRYGSIFPIGCINRKFETDFNDRAIMQMNISEVKRAASLVRDNGKSIKSHVFILVNSPKYGGVSILWASQTNFSSVDTFTHELGHSIGGLGDEYVLDGDPCLIFNVGRPNISLKSSSASGVKWARWIDENTPIPTPEISEFFSKTGLFKGASGCSSLFYRPQADCKMRNSEVPFCNVCREQMVLRFLDDARPIDGELVVSPYSVEGASSNQTFKIEAKVLKTDLETRWFVDGALVSTQPTYLPLVAKLTPGKHSVWLVVQDKTPYVRRDPCHLAESRSTEIIVGGQK